MMLNLSFVLLFHHVTLSVFGGYTFLVPEAQNPVLCLLTEATTTYTLLVLVFLMSAEALNVFVKIVLVFKTIDNYVLKASIVSWSKLQALVYIMITHDHGHVLLFTKLHMHIAYLLIYR